MGKSRRTIVVAVAALACAPFTDEFNGGGDVAGRCVEATPGARATPAVKSPASIPIASVKTSRPPPALGRFLAGPRTIPRHGSPPGNTVSEPRRCLDRT
jgi:hypothetical protein